jgi:hypothetical protein
MVLFEGTLPRLRPSSSIQTYPLSSETAKVEVFVLTVSFSLSLPTRLSTTSPKDFLDSKFGANTLEKLIGKLRTVSTRVFASYEDLSRT